VKFLVQKGANINASGEFSSETSDFSCVLTRISDKDGYTSLYAASLYGWFEVAKFLVEKGANHNVSCEFSSETSESAMCAHLNFRQGRIHQPLKGLSEW
jgi:ankyrin repeat protein